MKKILSVCLILMIALPVAFSFVGCNYLNDFPDLSGYIANVTDATGVGISKLTKTSATGKNGGLFAAVGAKHDNKQLSADGDGKNYAMVGNDNGFEELSFTKIIADAAAELIQGETRVIASSNKDTSVDIVSRTDNSITIAVDPMCEYRAVDMDGNVLVEWGKFETDTHTFDIAQARDAKVECRSLEAKISFNTLEGFEYTICHNGQPVMEGLRDNDDNDNSKSKGFAEWGHFTEGESYEVRYKGHGKKDECSQDKLGADIDKLYTVNGFTFISFVAKGKSKRPSDREELYLDKDGVNIYDKIEYFTDRTRKSFVIDNATGYVYPLVKFHVLAIVNGLLIPDESQDNKNRSCNYVYDFKTTEDGQLNIYQLFSNTDVDTEVFSCKDKYGHKYVLGPFPDGYDNTTDTYYFNISENSPSFYCTSSGEVVSMSRGSMPYNDSVKFRVSTENGEFREINESDNFTYFDYNTRCLVQNGKVICYEDNMDISHDVINAGWVYYEGYERSYIPTDYTKKMLFYDCSLYKYEKPSKDFVEGMNADEWIRTSIVLQEVENFYGACMSYLSDYNTVLFLADGKLIQYKNVLQYVRDYPTYHKRNGDCDHEVLYCGNLKIYREEKTDQYTIAEISYDGKKEYEVAVEYIGNSVRFRLVEKNSYTYTRKVVTLQPINR